MKHQFSERYIKMAKAAEEVQDIDHQFPGNFFFDFNGDVWVMPASMEGEEFKNTGPWLPRLDQLLEMRGGSPTQFIYASVESGTRVEVQIRPIFDAFPEWHELAIAMLMRDKFGKAWDGDGWVKA